VPKCTGRIDVAVMLLARVVAGTLAALSFGFALPAAAANSLGPAISVQTELGGEFPDNCFFPLGWTTPAGATTGWTVDFNEARSGACSLRSKPMGDSPSGFSNKAQLQVTGQFASSALRFAAKTSSESSWDCLRVFIDGVEQNEGARCVSSNGGLGISGETPWTLHTIPLPDGVHTILWSYEKDVSVSNGSDAAWIDDVEIVPVTTPFPASCILPPGWMVPAGANAGWSAVADASGSGPCSLKSAPIGNLGKAQIQLTAVFEAGTISFARRVSSQAGFDCLKFFIDDVEQGLGALCFGNGGLGISGNATWDTVELPIAAGAHVIKWSYEKDGSAVSGSDAAWIDNVVLPSYFRTPSAPYLDFVSRDTEGNATFSASPPDDDGGSPIVEYILEWRQQGDTTIEGQQSYFSFLPSTLHISGLASHGPYVVSLRARNDFADGPATEVPMGNDACGAPAEGYAVTSSSFDGNGNLAFAARPVNGSGSVTVTIENKDGFVANVYLAIDSQGDFSSNNINDCEFMSPFSTCQVTINFSPLAAGTRTGTLSVDGPAKLRCNREGHSYPLTGAGIALSQTITFGPLAGKTFGDPAFPISATASSGLPVEFSSQALSVCTVAGSTVTIVSAGTCTIAANQGGNEAYSAAPLVTQSFTVAKASQAITFNTLPNRAVNQGAFTPTATASSGLAVAFSSTTPSICTVSSGSVNTLALGTCTIAADQAGNANYLAAPQVARSFQVTAALTSQAITFNALANKMLGDPPFTISATASSGLPVAFTSLTPAVCTVATSTVSLVATGTCTIAANQAGDDNYLAAAQVTRSFEVTPAVLSRLTGISTRMQVLTGNDVMIGGFIIGGSAPKTVVVRARGPSLGLPGALGNPTMTVVPAAGGPNMVNDDWGTAANAAQLQASGFAPGDPAESAILATLNPGAYTAIVSGVGNTTGIAIVEVYEIDHPEAPMIAISTRGQVLTGNDVMIGGFIIQGSGPQTVVVRARGPSLGIPGSLLNPTMTIVPAAGGPNLVNDDWQTAANAAALATSGFAPSQALEAALMVALNPGAYTVIISGVNNSTGVALLEIYSLD